ncbi:DUF58 domain-containing protein [Candidatus Bipolaricaulota sp. J31]
MEPRGKLRFEIWIAVGAVFAGLLLASAPLVLFGAFLFTRLLLGLMEAARLRDAYVEGRASFERHIVEEGDTAHGRVEIRLRKGRYGVVFLSEDERIRQNMVDGEPGLCVAPGKEGASWEYAVIPPRGVYREGLVVELRDPGLYISRWMKLPRVAELWVLPRVEKLGRVRLSPRRTLVTPGLIPSRRGGTGILFFGTRPHFPGEGGVKLNWRALARYGVPVVNVYEEERATAVALVVDCRARVYRELGCPEAFDHAVRAAASLARALLDAGHRVGLLLYGKWPRWLPPGSGRVHRYRILCSLAGAEPGESFAFAELRALPLRFFPGGSSVIVVSSLAADDEGYLRLLALKGYDVGLVIPDPLSLLREKARRRPERLALELMSLERELMYARLAAAGVRLAIWDPEVPLAAALEVHWGQG